MQKLVLGLVIFLGTHSLRIFAPGVREAMVARMGPGPWKMAYSVVSLFGFVLIVGGYAQARLEPVLIYNPPLWLRHVAALVMLPVFPLLLASYLPGRIKSTVKHPMLAATKAWAVAHLLANGMLADILLFGGFLGWAVLDRISVGKRPQIDAPATGPLRNDIIAVVVGLAIYVVFVVWAHKLLIGVPPFG